MALNLGESEISFHQPDKMWANIASALWKSGSTLHQPDEMLSNISSATRAPYSPEWSIKGGFLASSPQSNFDYRSISI